MPRPAGPRTLFMRALHEALGGVLMMPGRVGLSYGLVYIAVRMKRGGINVNSLYVNANQRGHGLGEYMLRHILVIADRMGLPLYLRPSPYGAAKQRPDSAALERWYRRFGFVSLLGKDAEYGWMVRRPRRPGSVRLKPFPKLRKRAA